MSRCGVRMIGALAVLAAFGASAEEPVRIQNRLLDKEHALFVSVGPAYLDRGDYFSNPGALLTAAWYPRQDDAIELRAAGFLSFANIGAQEVFDRTGLVPEAQRPQLLLMAGGRHSFGYGKVLALGTVVHFDVQIAGSAGALKTDRAWAPALYAAPGLLVRAGPRLFLQAEVGGMASLEREPRRFVSFGVMPALTAGVRW